jgi:hypothetical protein
MRKELRNQGHWETDFVATGLPPIRRIKDAPPHEPGCDHIHLTSSDLLP